MLSRVEQQTGHMPDPHPTRRAALFAELKRILDEEPPDPKYTNELPEAVPLPTAPDAVTATCLTTRGRGKT